MHDLTKLIMEDFPSQSMNGLSNKTLDNFKEKQKIEQTKNKLKKCFFTDEELRKRKRDNVIRGQSVLSSQIIIDDSDKLSIEDAKIILSRINDSSKVIIIGGDEKEKDK